MLRTRTPEWMVDRTGVREAVMGDGRHVARLMSAESGLTGPTGEVVG